MPGFESNRAILGEINGSLEKEKLQNFEKQ